MFVSCAYMTYMTFALSFICRQMNWLSILIDFPRCGFSFFFFFFTHLNIRYKFVCMNIFTVYSVLLLFVFLSRFSVEVIVFYKQ